jgi:hypothetical protein
MHLSAFSVILFSSLVSIAFCGSKNKPHGHKGVLEAYTGKPISFKISPEQNKKLDSGEPVT